MKLRILSLLVSCSLAFINYRPCNCHCHVVARFYYKGKLVYTLKDKSDKGLYMTIDPAQAPETTHHRGHSFVNDSVSYKTH